MDDSMEVDIDVDVQHVAGVTRLQRVEKEAHIRQLYWGTTPFSSCPG